MARKSSVILSVFVIAASAVTGFAQTKPKAGTEKAPAAKPSKPQRIVYKAEGRFAVGG